MKKLKGYIKRKRMQRLTHTLLAYNHPDYVEGLGWEVDLITERSIADAKVHVDEGKLPF